MMPTYLLLTAALLALVAALGRRLLPTHAPAPTLDGHRHRNTRDGWQPLDLPVLRADSGQDDKRTVRATRRRRPTTPADQRERADAPRRDRPQQQARPPARPPTGGGGGSARPMGGAPTGLPRGRMGIGGIVLLAIVVLAFMLLSPGGDNGSTLPDAGNQLPAAAPQQPQPVATLPPLPTPTPRPFTPPPASDQGQTWLVMLYQDADDKVLEQDIFVDMNEAERIGSTDQVHVVAQLDRFRAGFSGDGDWSSTRRYYITQDNDLNRVGSQLVADLGEVDMSDGQTLVDFVTWAIETFPADKHVLILSDHGLGWPGGWSDPTTSGAGNERSIPMAQALGGQLYLNEMDDALAEIRSRTGLDKFEMIGMDACLMGHLEVFSALAPHARYAVASQETEPALGWAYASFLDDLTANPGMGGAELSRIIVQSYIQDDQRIVDDQARAEFAGRSSFFGPPSKEQLAQQLSQNITLTAVDLAAMPGLTDSVNELAYALQGANQRSVAQARNYAQSFTSIFGQEVPASYIDLGNFVQMVAQASRDGAVTQAAQGVLGALRDAVIAEKHGPNKPGATGISIYFPNSQLYASPVAGAQSYTAIARRFAGESSWDDFLAFHYTGRSFQRAANVPAVPDRSTTIVAPAAGGIQVSPVKFSAERAAPGRPVVASADISGENLGYIKLFVGFYDQAANSLYVADTDFLESADTRQVDGVYFPNWGEGAFTLEFEWDPVVFAIDDGSQQVPALFTPQTYGASTDQAVYSVEGIYTYGDDGEQRRALVYFVNGVQSQVFGFTGDDTGAPRQIVPRPGDRFTVLDKWLDLDSSGNVTQVTMQPGATLIFGDQPLAWQDLNAAAGEYVVGFIVEDLDGNARTSFGQVIVE